MKFADTEVALPWVLRWQKVGGGPGEFEPCVGIPPGSDGSRVLGLSVGKITVFVDSPH